MILRAFFFFRIPNKIKLIQTIGDLFGDPFYLVNSMKCVSLNGLVSAKNGVN